MAVVAEFALAREQADQRASVEIIRDPARLSRAKAFILDGLSDGSLNPIIARTFRFEEIVEAHRFLESNAQFGKIVVTI